MSHNTSFVRFSHEENSYMNSSVNGVDDIASKVDERRLLVMYPGDVWSGEDGVLGRSEVEVSTRLVGSREAASEVT